MEKVYGQGIFKAILETHDERYVADFMMYKEQCAKGPTDF
jgi:hypothetical protein